VTVVATLAVFEKFDSVGARIFRTDTSRSKRGPIGGKLGVVKLTYEHRIVGCDLLDQFHVGSKGLAALAAFASRGPLVVSTPEPAQDPLALGQSSNHLFYAGNKLRLRSYSHDVELEKLRR
jgi:hypothetical protein